MGGSEERCKERTEGPAKPLLMPLRNLQMAKKMLFAAALELVELLPISHCLKEKQRQ